ncbi:MAG: hypothetical protein RL196_1393 [Actinomycetota bacterium]|jgi:hypothetical protein
MVSMMPQKLKADENLGEKLVFTALQGVVGREDWVVIHSLKQAKVLLNIEAETDFIVFVPGQGIVIIESKGATAVTVEGDDWTLEGVPAKSRHKNPFTQVDNAKRNIRGELISLGFEVDEIPIARLVWLPRIGPAGFAQGRTGMAFDLDELAFQNDLAKPHLAIEKALQGHIERYANNTTIKYVPASLTQELAIALAEAVRPSLRARQTPAERAIERRHEVNRSTEEQLLILDLVAKNNLIYFEGPAGSGKTHILEKAAMQTHKDGRRVLYVCYNEMLAEKLRKDLGKVAGITVMHLNELLLGIVGLKKNPAGSVTAWFDEVLPAKALDAVLHNAVDFEFEAVCIDEFQDIAARPVAFDAILGLLSNKLRPFKVLMAGDDQQQIYTSGAPIDSFRFAKSQLPNLTHVGLNTNCRQAPALSRAIHKLLGWPDSRLRHRLTDDLPSKLEVFSTTADRQAKDLAKVIKGLLVDYAPDQIRVLSIFGAKQSAAARLFDEAETHSKELRELKAQLKHPKSKVGPIHWRSVGKYKGLEDEVIVITDVSLASAAWLASRGQSLENQLYVGLTRARSHAVLLTQDGLYASQAQKLV